MGRIFISHAHADKALIDPFVVMLQTGANVRQEDIFCTSLEGTGIPTGSDFVAFIRDQFKTSDFVVMVITPSYYESLFCLCELGATWISGSNAMPFLVPPLEYDDLKAVLSTSQAAFINDKHKLSELRDRLIKAGIASGTTSRWENQRDIFIKLFKRIQAKLPGRTVVDAAEFEAIKVQYDQAQEDIVEKIEEIDRLNALIEALKACKDQDEVSQLLYADMDETEQFNELIEAIQVDSVNLSRVVHDAIYYWFKDEKWDPETGFGTDVEWNSIRSAEADGMLQLAHNTVYPNDRDPKIKRILHNVGLLRDFISAATPEFVDHMTEQNDFEFSVSNRKFWKKYIQSTRF